eukprot:CAMPEP_0114576330 /NCGR_PEP_ID=MMETSP0125-20121206/1111_1 /TAXON_ID=485358 ORGANISM="Aristerostoma sp., Strain ATCC 50986" /NCGR_SAMPLE_ID=MMETSP0125 /ASSEMBLY_ACC=CAM_ASM_000245 /LENGTH=180 /DNA_ID=CAMNT_0001764775 /DNA_START=738 /DNA_END=1281 /DNA_ORIENTATION=-
MNNETFFDNISTSSFNNITFFVKLNDEIGQTVLDFGQKYLYFLISDEDSKVSNSYTSASCNNTWCNFTNEKTKIAGRPFTNVTFDMVYRSTSIPDIEFFFGGKLRECQAGEYNNTDLEFAPNVAMAITQFGQTTPASCALQGLSVMEEISLRYCQDIGEIQEICKLICSWCNVKPMSLDV